LLTLFAFILEKFNNQIGLIDLIGQLFKYKIAFEQK